MTKIAIFEKNLHRYHIFYIFALANVKTFRTHSSVGQSSGLIIRRSWDHAPLGPQFIIRRSQVLRPFFLSKTQNKNGGR